MSSVSKRKECKMTRLRKIAAALALLAGLMIQPLAAQPMKFRITLNTGPNHVRNIALKEFVRKLADRTEGKLDVQVFASGQLYKGPDVPKALAQGAIEMGVPIILYIARTVPNAGLLDLPMFYGRSIGEIHKVMDGKVGGELVREIEDKLNVKVIGKNLDLGHGSIFTTEKPATSLASLEGLTLRVPGSAAAKVRYNSLGVDSQSISFSDVPIALAQNTIDGLMTTHETVRSAKLWESGLKYALDTQGTFLQYIPMIGRPTWDKLDPQTRRIITDTWRDTVGGARRLAADRQKTAREEAEKNGVKVTQASREELAAFREKLMAEQAQIVKDTRMDPGFVRRAQEALR